MCLISNDAVSFCRVGRPHVLDTNTKLLTGVYLISETEDTISPKPGEKNYDTFIHTTRHQRQLWHAHQSKSWYINDILFVDRRPACFGENHTPHSSSYKNSMFLKTTYWIEQFKKLHLPEETVSNTWIRPQTSARSLDTRQWNPLN